MSATPKETEPGFSFSDDTEAKAPLKVWITILLFVGAGIMAWAGTKSDVANNTRRIEDLEESQRSLAVEQRQQRDILIRIDANVAVLKERLK